MESDNFKFLRSLFLKLGGRRIFSEWRPMNGTIKAAPALGGRRKGKIMCVSKKALSSCRPHSLPFTCCPPSKSGFVNHKQAFQITYPDILPV